LKKDAPVSRAVELAGHILCRPVLGGLHHRYGFDLRQAQGNSSGHGDEAVDDEQSA
jgi:hypothetical protein